MDIKVNIIELADILAKKELYTTVRKEKGINTQEELNNELCEDLDGVSVLKDMSMELYQSLYDQYFDLILENSVE